MKTEIGGTFKWSHKQIQAYARVFREGDAVKIGGEWYEVKGREVTGVHPGDVHAARPKVNPYNLNYRRDGDVYYEGVARGFLESWVDSPHEVVMPEDYKVQKGDKLVWLGDTSNSRTFGWMYNVVESEDGRLIYFNNKQNRRLADSDSLRRSEWAVIPRYENVKEEKEMNGNDECVGKFKKGDRVKVTGGGYKGCEGAVTQSDELNGKPSYAVLLDDGCGGRWFAEEFLESIEEEEKSPEQEAFDYLLSQSKDETRRMLEREVALWAEVNLAHRKHDDLRRAINILEKLEKGE